MHLFYVIGTYLVFLLLVPVLLLHPKLRDGWARRLGVYPLPFPKDRPSDEGDTLSEAGCSAGRLGEASIEESPSRCFEGHTERGGEGGSRGATRAAPRIWFHGASAGDLSALSPMIAEVRQRLPDATLIVSCLTNSGAVMARKRLDFVDAITYQPWDLHGATRRAVEAIRPDLLVIEYTEIWPNLIRAARRFGARIVLTNGRFSERNVPRYKALFAIAGRPLSNLDLLLMRTDEEAERALALGAPSEKVRVTGNTKFDALLVGNGHDPEELRCSLGIGARAPVLVAGSTHEGEEQILLGVYDRLLKDLPDLRLILAPRYLERVGRVLVAVEKAGFSAIQRSEAPADSDAAEDGGASGDREEGRPKVGVLDTVGELVTCYRLASLVFVGGSFTNRGGQNILEPASQGKPVIFGPNMDNFRDSVKVLVGRGGIQVGDGEGLYKIASELLARPEKLTSLGELASSTVHAVRGASKRNVEAMLALLEDREQSAPADRRDVS